MTTRARTLVPAAAVLAAAVAVACSSSDGPNIPQDATIAIDLQPALTDGGYAPILLPAAFVGTTQTTTLQILNNGRHALTVSNLQLAAADGGPLKFTDAGGVFTSPTITPPIPAVIGGLDAGFVQFSFVPNKAGKVTARLIVDSDAPARPHIAAEVDACGVAVDAGADAGC